MRETNYANYYSHGYAKSDIGLRLILFHVIHDFPRVTCVCDMSMFIYPIKCSNRVVIPIRLTNSRNHHLSAAHTLLKYKFTFIDHIGLYWWLIGSMNTQRNYTKDEITQWDACKQVINVYTWWLCFSGIHRLDLNHFSPLVYWTNVTRLIGLVGL